MKRDKLEIIYSIIILVTIPVIVAINTIILIQLTNTAFNNELNRKADLANNIIARYSSKSIRLEQYGNIKTELDSLESSQLALMQSKVIIKKNNDFTTVAHSSSTNSKLNQSEKTQAELVISHKKSIANLINTYDRKTNPAQAWNVMTPVIEGDEVIAIISANYLTIDAQEAISSAYKQSLIILIISIILIFGLLFRHFKLVGYAQLLARQKELNQTMSDFLSVATHELKSPTSIIKGYLSNVMDGDYGNVEPQVREQIQVALSQTDRLNALVQDLLNVSRVEQGRVEYNIKDVDITKIINLIIENYRPISQSKGLVINYTPDNNIPHVKADESRLQEVFTNLIDNAIKYTEKGSVTISHQVKKGRLVTNIHDTGLGMSPSARKRLFQRFYRVKTEKTQYISGTGLGLWIIKQYIEAMGGYIDVESIEGVGSNFIVELSTGK
ncbi:MAG TPA: HAMP domain-containing sensor histidine kinase [Candidatus Saccharibacteria bacterium]|nr:HAMP domain-containing sensor histidine kinase [Candidatus Saccharibacteria bacterium]